MIDLWDKLKATKKPIVLYGMGNGADKIISVLQSKGIEISGVFASDDFVRNKVFHGFKVEKYSDLKARYKDMVVLLCFGTTLENVLQNIKRIASEQELYAPDVPVYGDVLFDGKYLENNRAYFERIYSLLADDISRKVFENTVKYKLSGKLQYLYDCETEPDELYESFLHLGDREIFVDLGAYRGDTVADFLSRVKSYSHIFAVEPDPKTFKKLTEQTKGIENITLINACVSDKSGKAPFDMNGSRGASISEGGALTDSVCIDDIPINSSQTLIKMDIEGAEKSAIYGGKNTILKYKPKMQISCYHKSEDLLQIPQAVLDIRSDYKIYMRHFKSVPAWDTCYYFI